MVKTKSSGQSRSTQMKKKKALRYLQVPLSEISSMPELLNLQEMFREKNTGPFVAKIVEGLMRHEDRIKLIKLFCGPLD